MAESGIIVGGGVIGMMSAYELHKAGKNVTVLDKSLCGDESSWAGGGILSPLYPWRYTKAVNALSLYSQGVYRDLVAELDALSGIDSEYVVSGMLIVDPDEGETAMKWCDKNDCPVDSKSVKEIARLVPGSDINKPGLYLPRVAQVRSSRFVRSLNTALEKKGVNIVENSEVTDLEIKDGRITGVQCKNTWHKCDFAVISAGAWSAQVLSSLKVKVDIKPMQGQMILYDAEPGILNQIILKDAVYIIPRNDGKVLVGSTLEDVGFHKTLSPHAAIALSSAAEDMIPMLGHFSIEEQWAGLRPASPRGVPFISEIPGVKGLYINSGHFRNGLLTAPASARLLADLILDREPCVDPGAYAVSE